MYSELLNILVLNQQAYALRAVTPLKNRS